MQIIVTLAFILTLVAGQRPVSVADPRSGAITAPTIIHKVDPDYSEAARAARIQGTVVLQVQISEAGVPKVTRVVRSLGYGLDEKAIAAVTEWRFKPAARDGIPVSTSLNIEVNFNMLGGVVPNPSTGPLSVPGTTSRASVNAIAIDPSSTNTIYAATRTGVYKTSDGGTVWRASGSFENVVALTIDPRNSTTLFAASLVSGIYKTTDSGATWKPLVATPSLGIQIDPSDSNTLYASTTRGISKSIDAGASWREILPGKTFSSLTINPGSSRAIVAITDSGDLFKSSDAGTSWQFIGGSIVEEPVRMAPGAGRPGQSVTISPTDTLDKSLTPPRLASPAEGAVFDSFPRLTTVRWTATPGAASYLVEWDFGNDGIWHLDAGKLPDSGILVQGTEFTFDFVGAQPGRWRVWPVNADGQHGIASEWRTFRYTR